MSFLVRDWMTFQAGRPRVVGTARGTDRVPETLGQLLAELNAAERAKSPAVFVKVDRILSRINRNPVQGTIQEYAGPIAECARCGDPFPTFGSHQSRFCSWDCRGEHQRFCYSRGQLFNRPAKLRRPRRARRINGQIRA